MANILLVEPAYRSKFPPLGLMRISAYHRAKGDAITFVRGRQPDLRRMLWNRIYISSLFTYELPRTLDTLIYYAHSVDDPSEDLVVGGIGVTLMPEYIKQRVRCRVIEGQIGLPDVIEPGSPPLEGARLDYTILDSVKWRYTPSDAYFCKSTRGCIRNCPFCAVPRLEPEFGLCKPLVEQVNEIRSCHGEKTHLVLMDNNVLAATEYLEPLIASIRELGFTPGAKNNGRLRSVDFNQGIDARLVTPRVARILSTICLSPVRLALDYDGMIPPYKKAVRILSGEGFSEFTNYVMFNFEDTPESFYNRLRLNLRLNVELGVRITGFPMRYIPINSVDRGYVGKRWTWRYLRGIQCILLATHGIVGPNPQFFDAAFGRNFSEFEAIVSMPDRYIIYRSSHQEEAHEWAEKFAKLSVDERYELCLLLERTRLRPRGNRTSGVPRKYASLVAHHYPDERKSVALF